MSIICQVEGTGISSQPDTSKPGASKPSVTSSSVGTSRNRQVPSRSRRGASLLRRARGGRNPVPGPRSVTYERVMPQNPMRRSVPLAVMCRPWCHLLSATRHARFSQSAVTGARFAATLLPLAAPTRGKLMDSDTAAAAGGSALGTIIWPRLRGHRDRRAVEDLRQGRRARLGGNRPALQHLHARQDRGSQPVALPALPRSRSSTRLRDLPDDQARRDVRQDGRLVGRLPRHPDASSAC